MVKVDEITSHRVVHLVKVCCFNNEVAKTLLTLLRTSFPACTTASYVLITTGADGRAPIFVINNRCSFITSSLTASSNILVV